nr:insulinase family protein [candidate division Zixibacteria bacterium]
MRKALIILISLLFPVLGTAVAQTDDIELDVRKFTLDNGMTVLVLEKPAAPVFSAIIRFNTGSVDEQPGITGISHLLEHMMFKGSKIMGTTDYEAEIPLMARIDSLATLMFAEQVKLQNPLNPPDSGRYFELREQIASVQAEQKKYVIKDELWGTYLKNGGTRLNASTGNDATNYYVSLPKNKLELWAFMESDRMQNNIFREFYSERDVVMEERRLGENNPRGRLIEAFNATMFWASPYEWPVVGWMSDLLRISREDVEDYFRSHYTPANAVAAIVGDVRADEVYELCKRYFGKIPSPPLPPPTMTVDAPQEGERRVAVEYDANPIAYIGWLTPRIGHPDQAALEVTANILSMGRTSRFYKNIKEKKLGNVSASSSASRYPDAFFCSLTPMGDHTIAELEEAVYQEIERLKTEPVSGWELQKVKNQTRASLIRSLDSNMGLAWRLSGSQGMTGDWGYFLESYRRINQVTAEDIMRVAGKYLTRRNRTVAYLVKTESEKPSAAAGKMY